jgi:hypothetical protein
MAEIGKMTQLVLHGVRSPVTQLWCWFAVGMALEND